MPMRSLILGYDPGGNGGHGVAVMEVARINNRRWRARSLPLLTECETVQEVMNVVKKTISGCRLIGCGIDTLTAWSLGESGWRPADILLRRGYPYVRNSVDSPNHINGSMCLNGALVLRWLRRRADKGGMITEAHPKVCYYALRRSRHPWRRVDRDQPYDDEAQQTQQGAKAWLLCELGLSPEVPADFGREDHRFDALLGCLAALQGVNEEWTADLHAQPDASVVHPFGQTHYWWPEEIPH